MGSLFSKKSKPEKAESRVTEHDMAVLKLKQQRDKMKQYLKRLEKSLEKEKSVARQLLKDGRKEKALLVLRKKRYREQMIDKSMNQMDNLERMISDIEEAQMQIEIVDSLSIGNDCLKDLHRLVSVEDVERIMDETREGVEYQREIDAILSGALTEEDESDVLKELDELLGESESELPDMPAVPDTELPTGEKDRRQKSPERRIAMAAS